MQGVKASNLLSRLSGLKQVLWIFVLLPTLAVVPVFGQVSVITLGLVSYDQSPAQTITTARDDSAANPLAYAAIPRLQYQITGLSLMHQNTPGLSSNLFFEQNDGSNLYDRPQYIYKKSNANGLAGGWVHVEAGYGQFCQYDYCFGSNAVELELRQPRCAYLRASFSF